MVLWLFFDCYSGPPSLDKDIMAILKRLGKWTCQNLAGRDEQKLPLGYEIGTVRPLVVSSNQKPQTLTVHQNHPLRWAHEEWKILSLFLSHIRLESMRMLRFWKNRWSLDPTSLLVVGHCGEMRSGSLPILVLLEGPRHPENLAVSQYQPWIILVVRVCTLLFVMCVCIYIMYNTYILYTRVVHSTDFDNESHKASATSRSGHLRRLKKPGLIRCTRRQDLLQHRQLSAAHAVTFCYTMCYTVPGKLRQAKVRETWTSMKNMR